tara:strand:- start:1666 stop:1818 length:153 start_codon:yes stop_codon:yes gene_type:complete
MCISGAHTGRKNMCRIKNGHKKRDIKPGIIFHIDRGAEFRAYQVQEVLSQ